MTAEVVATLCGQVWPRPPHAGRPRTNTVGFRRRARGERTAPWRCGPQAAAPCRGGGHTLPPPTTVRTLQKECAPKHVCRAAGVICMRICAWVNAAACETGVWASTALRGAGTRRSRLRTGAVWGGRGAVRCDGSKYLTAVPRSITTPQRCPRCVALRPMIERSIQQSTAQIISIHASISSADLP